MTPARATCPPPRIPTFEAAELRARAEQALHLWPGAVGELVAREIVAAVEFGYLGPTSLLMRLVAAVDAEQDRAADDTHDRAAQWAVEAFRGPKPHIRPRTEVAP